MRGKTYKLTKKLDDLRPIETLSTVLRTEKRRHHYTNGTSGMGYFARSGDDKGL